MDIILISIGLILVMLGIAGCFLPIIPGPPLSYLGLIALQLTKFVDFSTNFLLIWALVTLLVTLMDYIIPIWGTKKFGGTKYGTWGSIVGLIIGLFLGPFGIIAGPFFGALIGELIGGRESNQAFRAALGAFLGFLLGTGIKLLVSGMMAYYFLQKTSSYIVSLF